MGYGTWDMGYGIGDRGGSKVSRESWGEGCNNIRYRI